MGQATGGGRTEGYAGADSVAVTPTRIRSKVRAAFPPGTERDLLLGETPRGY